MRLAAKELRGSGHSLVLCEPLSGAPGIPDFTKVLQFLEAKDVGMIAQHKAEQCRAGAGRASDEQDRALGYERRIGVVRHLESRCMQLAMDSTPSAPPAVRLPVPRHRAACAKTSGFAVG